MNCRSCGQQLFKPLLTYKNMPMSAQELVNLGETDSGIDYNVYQCDCCRLVQLDCDPVSYYKDVIRSAAYSTEGQRFRYNQFAEFVNKYKLHRKKIIEVGCGRGEYLSLLSKCGLYAYGIEHNSESVSHCQQNGLIASQGYIDQNWKTLEDFDAFCSFNFLEHCPDPNELLQGIYRNTTDDVIGLIEVPNFDMMIKNNLFAEFISDHLMYFTLESLRNLLESNGFYIVEYSTIFNEYVLSAIVRKIVYSRELSPVQFKLKQYTIKAELEQYISACNGTAIWGAGHQSFTILSLAELEDKIVCVVDDAMFKQGKFTPITHIPIISPFDLHLLNIDSIIVIAGGYSDEIVEKIKLYHKKIKHIAILRPQGLELCL